MEQGKEGECPHAHLSLKVVGNVRFYKCEECGANISAKTLGGLKLKNLNPDAISLRD